MKPSFQNIHGGFGEESISLYGLWTINSDPQREALPFDSFVPAGIVEGGVIPRWSADLPADYDLAKSYLRESEMRLRATQAAVSVAAERLKNFVGAQTTSGTQFGALDEADAGLETLLSSLQKRHPVVGFSLTADLDEKWELISEQFRRFINHLLQIIVNYAWVETHHNGNLLARTVVSWTGDFKTFWREGTSPAKLMLHQRMLDLALKYRDILLRTFVIITEGVIKLSVLVGSGGGVLALPAVWKYVQEILAQIELLRQLEKSS